MAGGFRIPKKMLGYSDKQSGYITCRMIGKTNPQKATKQVTMNSPGLYIYKDIHIPDMALCTFKLRPSKWSVRTHLPNFAAART